MLDCTRTFSINIGFEGMKHNPKAITTAMQLYFSGESLRNTEKSLRFLGIDVSHQTVNNWIEKYSLLMKQYVDKLKPNVGDTWRAVNDEKTRAQSIYQMLINRALLSMDMGTSSILARMCFSAHILCAYVSFNSFTCTVSPKGCKIIL